LIVVEDLSCNGQANESGLTRTNVKSKWEFLS